MVGALDVPIYLGAEESARHGVIRVARDSLGAAILHRHEHGAGVGTIMWARAANDPVVRNREVGGHSGSRHDREKRARAREPIARAVLSTP